MSIGMTEKGQQPRADLKKDVERGKPMPTSMRPTMGQEPQRKLDEQVEAYKKKGWLK